MKTKTNAACLFVILISIVLIVAPHVKATAISFYKWVKPLVLANLKAQAGTEVTYKTLELLDVAQVKVSVAVTSVKPLALVIMKEVRYLKKIALAVPSKARQLYTHEFTINFSNPLTTYKL